LYVLAVLVLLVGALRIIGYNLIDWDEGVFALQGRWFASSGVEGKPFNFQTPPLYPLMVGALFKIGGPDPRFLPILSLLFSVLTLYAIFYYGRRIYDETTALYAIAVFVTSEFFLFFLRSGLSEAVFLFFFWSAFASFVAGLGSGRTRDFLVSGIFTTLALYTKYSAPVLIPIFAVIGGLHWKNINRKWLLLTIVLPALAFAPYLYVFVRYVTPSVIAERHFLILGLNHLRFLYYLLVFSPAALLLAAFYSSRIKKADYYLYIALLIFFVVLGFYRPYFRLAYPLIPILAFLAGRMLVTSGKWRPYLLAFTVLVSLALGWRTISYRSRIPAEIASEVERLMRENKIGYCISAVPPNILAYLPGRLPLTENHPAVRLGQRFPGFMRGRQIIKPDDNLLVGQEQTIFLYSTVMDPLKSEYEGLLNRARRRRTWDFIDAPVYYRDIFNPLRNRKQLYEIYWFEHADMKEDLDKLWRLGFKSECQVINYSKQ
jgi:hypothetical protein